MVLASWYQLHGDLYFHSDIGRDFMLLRQIEEKKLMLIGARTGGNGIYHGNFWYYLNFPVYYISNGNPIAVGWFWIFLVAVFLYSGFFIAKKLFDEWAAWIFVLFSSNYMILKTNAFSHPDGAVLLSMVFFYSVWRYFKTLEAKYLCANIILSGLLVHLEVVSGVPLAALSFLFATFVILKNKKYKHFLAFFLILLPMSTYIIFDLRHEFFQTKSVIAFLQGTRTSGDHYLKVILNRLEYMTTIGTPIIQYYKINQFIVVLFTLLLLRFGLFSKKREIYLIFLYFFVGFFVISLIVPLSLLRHHFLTFVPLVFLMFASLTSFKWGKLLIPIFALALIYNTSQAISFVKKSDAFIGKSKESWKFLNNLSANIFKNGDGEFAYFVNAPDKFGYSAKYAMVYQRKVHPEVKVTFYDKKPVTYVIDESPPVGQEDLNVDWWTKVAITITKDPVSVVKYQNGYKVMRFELTPEEVNIFFHRDEDTGIHFR